jgi:hypothetical protein
MIHMPRRDLENREFSNPTLGGRFPTVGRHADLVRPELGDAMVETFRVRDMSS